MQQTVAAARAALRKRTPRHAQCRLRQTEWRLTTTCRRTYLALVRARLLRGKARGTIPAIAGGKEEVGCAGSTGRGTLCGGRIHPRQRRRNQAGCHVGEPGAPVRRAPRMEVAARIPPGRLGAIRESRARCGADHEHSARRSGHASDNRGPGRASARAKCGNSRPGAHVGMALAETLGSPIATTPRARPPDMGVHARQGRHWHHQCEQIRDGLLFHVWAPKRRCRHQRRAQDACPREPGRDNVALAYTSTGKALSLPSGPCNIDNAAPSSGPRRISCAAM